MSGIDATLAERGARYGTLVGHALITQGMKQVMHASPKWSVLRVDQKEALEMVAHKIGRILNGDPDYIDSWTDIIGYTRLVEVDLISREAANAPSATTGFSAAIIGSVAPFTSCDRFGVPLGSGDRRNYPLEE